jgi:hypothetical protein
MIDTFSNPTYSLARGQLAGIDNLVRLLQVGILVGSIQRGARQSHETGPGGLENAERSNEFEERVYPGRLRRAVRECNQYESGLGMGHDLITYTSTMQLLVLMSRTFPPN